MIFQVHNRITAAQSFITCTYTTTTAATTTMKRRQCYAVQNRTRKVTRTIVHFAGFTLSFLFLLVQQQIYVVQSQVGVCYSSLEALNTEMQTELTGIQNGNTPQSSYTFVICPNTFLDTTSTALLPVLDNALFLCGEDGNQANNCVFLGGTTEQVRFEDSTVDGYIVKQVTFTGMKFSSFGSATTNSTAVSIGAYASGTTTAKFTDVTWEEFTSAFVIRQQYTNPDGTDSRTGSMIIEIDNATIQSGTAGAIFDNDRGSLRLNNVQVNDVTAAALIATANVGTSFLENSIIDASAMDSVTYTTAGATQTVANTRISNMNFLEDTFYVEDESSQLTATNVTLEENTAITAPWNGFVARNKASLTISDSNIIGNAFVRFVAVSFDSSISIATSSISRNRGVESSQNVTSSPIFGITDASIELDEVTFSDNAGFSGEIISLIRSSIVINRSCFRGGSSQYVVFVANDASFQQSENFIESYTSSSCPAPGPRLFQENAGSGCFLGSSQCEGDCLELADQPTCRAETNQTIAPSGSQSTSEPSIQISSIPSLAPTQGPVVATTTPTDELLSNEPTSDPVSPIFPTSVVPSFSSSPPTSVPSEEPSRTPVVSPSSIPTTLPTHVPSTEPTISSMPTVTPVPSSSPTVSAAPTKSPAPSSFPSMTPSLPPSVAPSRSPSKRPIVPAPTSSPVKPTKKPIGVPSSVPTPSGKKKKCKSAKGEGKGKGKGNEPTVGKGKGKGKGSTSTSKGKGKGTIDDTTSGKDSENQKYDDDNYEGDDDNYDGEDDCEEKVPKGKGKGKGKGTVGKGKGKGTVGKGKGKGTVGKGKGGKGVETGKGKGKGGFNLDSIAENRRYTTIDSKDRIVEGVKEPMDINVTDSDLMSAAPNTTNNNTFSRKKPNQQQQQQQQQ